MFSLSTQSFLKIALRQLRGVVDAHRDVLPERHIRESARRPAPPGRSQSTIKPKLDGANLIGKHTMITGLREPHRPQNGGEQGGVGGSTIWARKLGSDGPPRRGRRVNGRSRGTAWRVILQASPVTLTSETQRGRGHPRPFHKSAPWL